MRDPSIRWQLGSKPQSRKHFVTVIVLDDFSNCLQGHSIGIQLVGAHVMKGSGLGWVTWTEVIALSFSCQVWWWRVFLEFSNFIYIWINMCVCVYVHASAGSPLEAVKSMATVKLIWVLRRHGEWWVSESLINSHFQCSATHAHINKPRPNGNQSGERETQVINVIEEIRFPLTSSCALPFFHHISP